MLQLALLPCLSHLHTNYFVHLTSPMRQLLKFSSPILYLALVSVSCSLEASKSHWDATICSSLSLDILQRQCIKFHLLHSAAQSISAACLGQSFCSLMFSAFRHSTSVHTALNSVVAALTLDMVLKVAASIFTWRCVPRQAPKCSTSPTEHDRQCLVPTQQINGGGNQITKHSTYIRS